MASRRNVLTKMRSMIRSGTISKPPAWYPILCQLPPFVPPPIAEAPANIVFPTDRLQRIYEQRNPSVVPDERKPYWEETTDPLALRFAATQLELMEKEGLSEAKAYRAAEARLARERKAALGELAAAAARFRELGDRPLLADPRLRAGLERWRARLAALPYRRWAHEEAVALDDWLVGAVLSWGRTRALHLKEGEFLAALGELRAALFPEVRALPAELEAFLGATVGGRGPALSLLPGAAAEEWAAGYRALAGKVAAAPFSLGLLHEVEDWVAAHHQVLPPAAAAAAADAAAAAAADADAAALGRLGAAVRALFPGLGAADAHQGGAGAPAPARALYPAAEFMELAQQQEYSNVLMIKNSTGEPVFVLADADEEDQSTALADEGEEEEEPPIVLPTFEKYMQEQDAAYGEARWRMREYARRRRRRKLMAKSESSQQNTGAAASSESPGKSPEDPEV